MLKRAEVYEAIGKNGNGKLSTNKKKKCERNFKEKLSKT